jgi:hypothetical protein
MRYLLALAAVAACPVWASDFESNMPPRYVAPDKSLSTMSASPSDPVTHDILILYTQAALTKYGPLGVSKLVQRVISDTNAAYQVSQVGITLALVDTGVAPVVEQVGGVCKTLSTLRSNAKVKALQDQARADMVLLLSVDTGGNAGCASRHLINGRVDAFAVAKTGSLGGKTPQHEIGHLQGLAHNVENPSSAPAYPWGYGYRLCVEPQAFRDIMSYACGGGVSAPRINLFGNPDVFHNGYPTGSATSNPARALNDNAAYVASYR